jgi:hypothetical protein
MIDFRQLPISFIIPWPAMILLGIGCLTILAGLGFGTWWIISHLQWMQ